MPNKKDAAEAALNADQLEAVAIRFGEVGFENCLIDDVIAFDDLPERYDSAHSPRTNEEWAETDGAKEAAIGELAAEIERRRDLLGKCYPFDVDAGRVLRYVPISSSSHVYEFCLAITLTQQNLSSRPCHVIPPHFERLVGQLLAKFLGDRSEWRRTGAPPDGDRPGTLSETIQELNKATKEWRLNTRLNPDEKQAEQGDGGIDVVVWKSLGDHRLGVLFLLAQCACGDDWQGKRKDLFPDAFAAKWNVSISIAKEIRCMAIPRHVPHDALWLASCAEAGIMLDRVRLTWLAETHLQLKERKEVKILLDPLIELLRAPVKHPHPATGKPKKRKS